MNDGPPVCEICEDFIGADDETNDPEGHPVHTDCLNDEIEQQRAEKAALRSGRGDPERW